MVRVVDSGRGQAVPALHVESVRGLSGGSAASLDDPFEALFARGVTDGLPVVPPTRERVEAAIPASGRPRDELIALVAPALGRATVERIAVNAVMAGCRPEYMPVVIAGVEALCDEGFGYACCFGEYEEVSPWPPLHVEHGFAPDESTIAALPGEPLQVVVDGQSRTAADVLTTVARSLEVIASHRTAGLGDTLLLVSPMHARTIAGDGWSKADARRYLWERLEARRDGPVPKFRAPEHLKLVVAGGTAGPFTLLIPGWPFPDSPSRLVLKKIPTPSR